MAVQELFTEKFRPQKMEQLIIPNRIRNLLGSGELHQNVLLYGSPGTGKTSCAKILAKNYPTLYINVSDETGIDIVREKITNWCSTISLLDGKENTKVVILDEMDGASESFYKALRATIERFAKTARFIGTCNYINKVPEPIQSRFEMINFDYASKEEENEVFVLIAKRIKSILGAAKIEIEKDALIEFTRRNFPDMRRMLNKIQTWYLSGIKSITINDIKQLNYSYSDVFNLIINKGTKPHDNYKFLMSNYSSKVDDVLASLGTEFPEFLKENYPDKLDKLPAIIIEIASHQSQRTQVIDPAITMLSCVYKLQTIIHT